MSSPNNYGIPGMVVQSIYVFFVINLDKLMKKKWRITGDFEMMLM